MSAVREKPAPSITKMICADHAHVIAVFHKFAPDAAPRTKQALVETICLALQLHAQLEEEILYPAARELAPELVEKSVPEHDHMRRLLSTLRSIAPDNADYDRTVLELMRVVFHHAADEETLLLPQVERMPSEKLRALAAQLAKRRRQLTLAHAAEMTRNAVRAISTSTVLVGAGALLAGGYVIRHALKRDK